jgi:hypothetical protein
MFSYAVSAAVRALRAAGRCQQVGRHQLCHDRLRGGARRRWMIVVVDGPSMAPSLVAGDRIRMRRVPPATVHSGDVVVAVRPAPGPRKLIVKRVAAGPGTGPRHIANP